jgi:hypothetical protein
MKEETPLRKLVPTSVFVFALGLAVAAAPCFAGIHYKSVTHTQDARNQTMNMAVEGWVSGDKAKVEFKESGNPVMKQGSYLITRDGGKTLYLVNPEDKTYAEWDMQAMLGFVGGVMQGMGPLLKFEFSDPKVEKLVDESGGTLLGLPTRHLRYRTSYTTKVKVLGMSNVADSVIEQDIWATDRLQDLAMGVWLRSDPPRTGNEQFDKLIVAEMGKAHGIPLKSVSVSTSTQQKKNQQTVTRSSMEVTQLDTVTVPDATFEIPAGYKETQLLPTGEQGQGDEEDSQGGLGGLLRRKKKSGGN